MPPDPPSRASEADARAAKRRHARALLATPGIAGVGVQRDPDDPAGYALVVHLDPAVAPPPLPAALDGVPVRWGDDGPFRALRR